MKPTSRYDTMAEMSAVAAMNPTARADPCPGDAARRLAVRFAALRALIGAGVILAPGPTLRSWAYPRRERGSGTVCALLQLLGGRDAVLGLATVAARGDPGALRRMVRVSAFFDAGDAAISLGLLVLRDDARVPALAWTAMAAPFSLIGWRNQRQLRD
jgi:hypothetical protein